METGMLRLVGMKDQQCAHTIAQALTSIAGVDKVDVSLDSARAAVTFDEERTSLALLKRAVQEAGYEIKPAHGEDGSCCGGCGG